MFKFFASAALVLALVSPAQAACDKAQAQEDLAYIEEGAAKRHNDPESTVVWYEWRDGWDTLSRDQKYSLVQGIGGLEKCLTGKQIRIRYHGKDVGYFTPAEKVELYD